MDGILDADVKAGRLTHEKARRLKEQVHRGQRRRFHATKIKQLPWLENDANSDAVDGDWNR